MSQEFDFAVGLIGFGVLGMIFMFLLIEKYPEILAGIIVLACLVFLTTGFVLFLIIFSSYFSSLCFFLFR